MSRRDFLRGSAVLAGAAALRLRGAVAPNPAWSGEVGLTTSSLFRQMTEGRADRTIRLLDLPKVMRDELGMKIIDLNSGTLTTHEPAPIERFRRALDDAGCVVSNLKVNPTILGVKVQDLPFDHHDRATRTKALAGYRDWLRAASGVGARWLRPFPAIQRPDFAVAVEGLTGLAEIAEELRVAILLENAGWMTADPDAIPRLVAALGGRIAAQPDIGSWAEGRREAGLARAFPHAVSCDFKVGRLGPGGEHKAYDLRRCFELGWRAGFRGPWCIEHAGENTGELFRELCWIRDQLKSWMRAIETTR